MRSVIGPMGHGRRVDFRGCTGVEEQKRSYNERRKEGQWRSNVADLKFMLCADSPAPTMPFRHHATTEPISRPLIGKNDVIHCTVLMQTCW